MKRFFFALGVTGPLVFGMGFSCGASAQTQEKIAGVAMHHDESHRDAKTIRSNRRRAKREKKNLAHLRLEGSTQTARDTSPTDATKPVRSTLNAKTQDRTRITGGF